MAVQRIVVYDFEGTTVGAPFESIGDWYVDEGAYVFDGPGVYGGMDNEHMSGGTYATPGYNSSRSLKISNNPVPEPGPYTYTYNLDSYSWSDWFGYRPDQDPPHLGRVCGLEVTFRVDPTLEKESILDVTLGLDGQGQSYSQVFFWFTTLPAIGGPGIWYGGAYADDEAGDPVGPGDLFEGDQSDVLPVDLTQWMTAKLLPTGEWSLAYADGGTILSGTLLPVRDGGGYLSVDTRLNNPIGQQEIADAWIDNVVFWVEVDDVPEEPTITSTPDPVRRIFSRV